jgi:hypothetical protein
MKCKQYYLNGQQFNQLPDYIEKDNSKIPTHNREGNNISPERMAQLGILLRVDATPDAGKIITQSHGELVNGQWVEVIDEQLTPVEIETAKEAEYQNRKSIERKKLDNYALELIASINTKCPALNIVHTDTADAVKVRAIELEIAFADIPELFSLSGTIGDSRLPAQPHIIDNV